MKQFEIGLYKVSFTSPQDFELWTSSKKNADSGREYAEKWIYSEKSINWYWRNSYYALRLKYKTKND